MHQYRKPGTHHGTLLLANIKGHVRLYFTAGWATKQKNIKIYFFFFGGVGDNDVKYN
jgi:hypothetical protein